MTIEQSAQELIVVAKKDLDKIIAYLVERPFKEVAHLLKLSQPETPAEPTPETPVESTPETPAESTPETPVESASAKAPESSTESISPEANVS